MSCSIDPLSIRFNETRRGVNATGTILFNERKMGTINDVAERIVTDVSFISEGERAAFNAEAPHTLKTVFGKADASDRVFISEYARALLQQAEKSLLSSCLTDQCPKE